MRSLVSNRFGNNASAVVVISNPPQRGQSNYLYEPIVCRPTSASDMQAGHFPDIEELPPFKELHSHGAKLTLPVQNKIWCIVTLVVTLSLFTQLHTVFYFSQVVDLNGGARRNRTADLLNAIGQIGLSGHWRIIELTSRDCT